MVADVTTGTGATAVTTCKKKSVILNLYPDLGHVDESPSNGFSFEVKKGAYQTFDLTADPLVTAPTAAKDPIPKAKLDLLNGIVDGAQYLSAAAAAISLAALTLY